LSLEIEKNLRQIIKFSKSSQIKSFSILFVF